MTFSNITIPLSIYFDIDYRVACAVAIVVFSAYCIIVLRKRFANKNVKRTAVGKDIVCGVFMSVYMALLMSWTILDRSIGEEYQIKFVPFWSHAELFRNWSRHLAMQIFYNILLFVPWGIIFPIISKTMQKIQWVALSAFAFSALIEVIQLVFKCGLFEFDDMFHNSLGAILGYVIWYRMKKLLSNIKEG